MLSWAQNSVLAERAKALGLDDALLMNEKGELAECTSANIFVVRGDKVLTPPLSAGGLAGVTREVLLEIAPQPGIEISEEPLTPRDLDSAEEVFISSTTREVAGVGSIHPNWRFPCPGRLTRELAAAFKAFVKSQMLAASRC